VLSSAAAQHPHQHVVVVVDRPAQALSHAQRLRARLRLPTAVFCGGDFLYRFPQQFEAARVLVFTAGLLLRLLKAGVYRLESASLLVLVDALTGGLGGCMRAHAFACVCRAGMPEPRAAAGYGMGGCR
jgi:hypothetical protein